MGGRTNKTVIIWDNVDGLSWIWRLGSTIGKTPFTYGVRNWDAAIAAIDMVYATVGEPIDVQIWGHGNDGKVYIAGKHLPLDRFADELNGKIREFWARSCETIKGRVGQQWAIDFVREVGATYVGHAVVTNWPNPLWQGRIAALRPGEDVWWPRDGKGLGGCITTAMTPPKHAYNG